MLRDNKRLIDNFVKKIDDAGKRLEVVITPPTTCSVSYGALVIDGSISNYRGETLYAFTGTEGCYWPSSRIAPAGNAWSAGLNVGYLGTVATITVAQVGQELADYIEFYREHAPDVKHPGLRIKKLEKILDTLELPLNSIS